ncbi:GNAT family N-acetyltransferase [Paenibacillus eucommiae]|uniref:GNAT superfamily N-acetyltransferase n=1 Tax=Paenibacillus eucommiae TaxID=1355755 RepID=A0ABS4IYM5_9BACL|nr:GNAT family N-acetyltransferase [Paenibacillus eucommiae]MBP1992690.1 GNAT superfamily N-acetyltransferase [Paenibacillus eucommiae]
MPDMLVKLYELPASGPLVQKLSESGIEIRRALAPEKHVVVEWVRQMFNEGWASECEVAFSRLPVSCYIAVENKKILGFACYDSTCKNFFGPTGVDETYRGKSIGKALLLESMHAMSGEGYAYAVIGGAGPIDFYAGAVGAVEIAGSVPGIYRGLL